MEEITDKKAVDKVAVKVSPALNPVLFDFQVKSLTLPASPCRIVDTVCGLPSRHS